MAEADLPLEPAAPTPGTVHVPDRAGGWLISDARQVCPECDLKMEGD